EEYDHDNNLFWSALEQPIIIERRPNLELASFVYDGGKRYHPSSMVEVNWTVANSGLGNVPGGLSLGQRIELRARDTRQGLSPGFSWLTDSILVTSLTEFSVSPFMPGVSPQKLSGHTVDF